ncbi:eukaryotic translation initiation factor 4G-like [Bidens hawaiensis]|uniref:eukaryotic translation initiation factor 4G-like n=1 Tax=Bidens hawaiensis TaxID=980011 RepID=UPI004049C76F
MSVNQSRRPGRSGNPNSPRNSYGGGGRGGSSGGNAGPPSSAFYSNKSYKKVVSNAPGAQTRVTATGPGPNLNNPNASAAAGRGQPNGAHVQPPLRGTPDASVGAVKPVDAPVNKSTPGLPKAPQSNAVAHGSGTTGPSTPVKGPADASKSFPLQFGSISPGALMQVPARTSSAPPNLDEQKRAQAQAQAQAQARQNPVVPNQHLPRKDPGPVDQPVEARPVSKEKKDVLSTPPGPVSAHVQKPTGPPMPAIPTGVSMQMPFHQSPIHIPFGVPNPPLQAQNIAANTVPLPMRLPVGNPPPQVPPQVFVPGMQHQGIIHQSQGLTFSGPQLGNMGGMGLGPQYQQQPMGNVNYGGARRTVKIIHPDTHEELRLGKKTDGYPNGGGSSGQRPQNAQSQAIPPAGHPINFYPNSYNASALFTPPPGSNPLTSSHSTPGSQPPRFYPQASKQVTIKQPAISSHAEKVVDSADKTQRAGGEGQPHKDSETVAGSSLPQSENLTNTSAVEVEVPKQATVNKSGSFKEEQKQPNKADKIGRQTTSVSNGSGVQETSQLSSLSSEISKDVSETSNKVEEPSRVSDLSSKCDNNEKGADFKPEVEESHVESKEHVKESVDQNQNSRVSDVTASIIHVDASSAETTLNMGSLVDDKKDNQVSEPEVDQVNSRESITVSVPETSSLTVEVEATGLSSPSYSGKPKGNTGAKGKKKIKEILKNADARGTTSDLYNAYKRPEEKKESLSATETVENPNSSGNATSEKDTVLSRGPTKTEPEDWEDAADISIPKVGTGLKQKHHSEDDNDGMTKKYSRDFLLKFSDHGPDLPEGFEITNDVAEVFVATGGSMTREPYPSPGRGGGDRSGAGSRLDRRPSNVGLDDRWSKGSGGPMGPGWEPNMGYPARGNHGVLRTPRGQPPGQSPGPQMQRNNSDSDRWQRTGYQKGLMPSPHTPMMHKAEKKYEIGKVTDEEQAKQRKLKSILNKLTPQNFEKLFEQVKQVNIDNADTLSGVIGQIFDKALMEPTFVEMYANFCSRLAVELPGFGEDNEKITFKRLLLNKCQEEFERGEREEEEANRTEEEGEIKQSEEEREEKRVKARRRMLGNIRLIGELYKKRMLTERIMHECIKKLLGFNQNTTPDEENIEALCKLMSTIGEMIDHMKAKEHMDAYFDMMLKLSNNMTLSSRVRFMLKDSIDLRKNKWQQRRKVEGPKKIEEVHRDAHQERQAQSSRLSRGPNSNSSLRRGGQPMDFGPRGSAGVLPSNPQMGGGYRGLPQQSRGFGNQDLRFDAFENRTLSVPVRPMGDETITLGPQGGLAKGMSVRGQPSMQSVAGPNNGYGGYGPRDDMASRNILERTSPRPVYDRVPPSQPEHTRVSTPPQSESSDKPALSEDRLHEMSIQAIKEFYSARDEKEVALCIKELNAPGFYPTMISIWVTDSFERKDMDQDSLTKLLINLTKSQENINLTQESLVRGFESVLSTLEDAVNDAPRAAEFLGRMFARILIENAIPFKQVSRMIYEGGEEEGQLVEAGLAAEVLGVILEIIKSEKGDPFLNDLHASSDIRLESFRSPSLKKTSRLDKFI